MPVDRSQEDSLTPAKDRTRVCAPAPAVPAPDACPSTPSPVGHGSPPEKATRSCPLGRPPADVPRPGMGAGRHPGGPCHSRAATCQPDKPFSLVVSGVNTRKDNPHGFPGRKPASQGDVLATSSAVGLFLSFGSEPPVAVVQERFLRRSLPVTWFRHQHHHLHSTSQSLSCVDGQSARTCSLGAPVPGLDRQVDEGGAAGFEVHGNPPGGL